MLSLALGVAAGIAGFVLWRAVDGNGLESVAGRVDRLSGPFGAARLGLIGLVAWLWPWFCGRGGEGSDGVDPLARDGLRLRWRVVGWLLVIELLVGRNLFGRFAAAIAGGAP